MPKKLKAYTCVRCRSTYYAGSDKAIRRKGWSKKRKRNAQDVSGWHCSNCKEPAEEEYADGKHLPIKTEKRCKNCGCRLRSGNTGEYCSPCQYGGRRR